METERFGFDALLFVLFVIFVPLPSETNQQQQLEFFFRVLVFTLSKLIEFLILPLLQPQTRAPSSRYKRQEEKLRFSFSFSFEQQRRPSNERHFKLLIRAASGGDGAHVSAGSAEVTDVLERQGEVRDMVAAQHGGRRWNDEPCNFLARSRA